MLRESAPIGQIRQINAARYEHAHSTSAGHRYLREIQAAQDIHEYLRETARAAPKAEVLQQRLASLRDEAALLQALAESQDAPERALILVRPVVRGHGGLAGWLFTWIEQALAELGFATESHYDRGSDDAPAAALVSGAGVWPLASAEAGVHMICRRHENLLPVQVSVIPAAEGRLPDLLQAAVAERAAWLADLAIGRAAIDAEPLPPGRIVRFYDDNGPTLDLRTGRSFTQFPTREEWRALLLGGLPLPAEWED